MRFRLRELGPTDKLKAAELVVAWGYPREVPPLELQVSVWYAYGTEALFWFNRDAEVDERTAKLHVCIAPAQRGRMADRSVLTAIEVLAHFLDVDRLVMHPAPELVRVLERFGWRAAREGREGWLELELPPAAAMDAYWWPGGPPGAHRVIQASIALGAFSRSAWSADRVAGP